MATLTGLLETTLYVDDLPRAEAFFADVVGLRLMTSDDQFSAFDVAGRQVLLLFERGAGRTPVEMPSGTIPAHDGDGPLHIAFVVPAGELPAWEARLDVHGVPVVGRNEWPQGGESLYFRDPDGHLIELATPGLWPMY